MMEYLIVGAAVSLLTATLKNTFGTESWKSVSIVIALSLVAGTVYWLIKDTQYWTSFVQILAYASLVYGVVIKQLQDRLK